MKAELSKKIKVFVAISGGVDSAVAASLLKKQGFEVIGVFMKFWRASYQSEASGSGKAPSDSNVRNGWNRCCSFEAQQRARAVARVLGIPFYVLNLEKQFKKKIVDYFLLELRLGRTPNPCVICNKEIKFGLLLKKVLAIGADYLATGHYARLGREFPISNFQFPNNKENNIKLLQAKDKNKDQSYFLWKLNQKQLAKILFPIGEIASKAEVRKLAKKSNLPITKTKESQEICFIKNTTQEFLKHYLKEKPGKITDVSGKTIGKHKGLWFYTIGQRKGLDLAQGPWFVIGKDTKNNNLIVSKNKKDLLQKELIANHVNWVSGKEPNSPLKIKAKIRYGSPAADAVIKEKISSKKYRIIFSCSQKAITPGQSVVFYKANELLGGGIIN